METANLNIKKLREQKNLSQEDFAERAGFSKDLLSKIERGTQSVTLDKATKIADAYDVSLDWIYGRTEDTSDTASSMLLYLNKLFNFKIDENYENPFILEIGQPILCFFSDYKMAEDMLRDGKIPEVAYTPWIEKIKSDLNSAIKDTSIGKAEYCLVPKNKVRRKDEPAITVSLGGPLGG